MRHQQRFFAANFFALSVAAGLATCSYAEDRGAFPFGRRNTVPRVAVPAVEKSTSGVEKAAATVVQFAPPRPESEVNTDEVIRRGDRVIVAGRGPMATGDALFAEATSPPPDDSHKWFFSVIVDDSVESRALLYDIVHEKTLAAWMDLNEGKSSWSHVKVYQAGDEVTKSRWSKIKFTSYPALVLQPPAKLTDERDPKSWEWGDPATVVYQWDGYPVKSADRAKTRSDQIRSAIELYIKTVSGKRVRSAADRVTRQTVGPGDAESTPGLGQIGGPPPFTLPGGGSVPTSNPFVGSDPTSPVASPRGAIGQLLSLAMEAMGSGGFWVFVLVAIELFKLYAKMTPGKGDDAIAEILSSLVATIKNPTATTPTATPPPTITGR